MLIRQYGVIVRIRYTASSGMSATIPGVSPLLIPIIDFDP